MGKYMRKSKSTTAATTSESPTSLMEITAKKSPHGVRTRAKTLALQSTTATATATTTAAAANNVSPSPFAYLQLRSRRLLRLKPPVYKEPRKLSAKLGGTVSPNPNLCNSSNCSPNSGAKVSPNCDEKMIGAGEAKGPLVDDNVDDVDACCGENVMDSDSKERSTRESTPSNLIRNPDEIPTPGSTTRPTSSAARRPRNPALRHLPTSHEMEEFFAGVEEQQQREFVEKYNFDPVNDKPLPGRYEWERVNSPGGT